MPSFVVKCVKISPKEPTNRCLEVGSDNFLYPSLLIWVTGSLKQSITHDTKKKKENQSIWSLIFISSGIEFYYKKHHRFQLCQMLLLSTNIILCSNKYLFVLIVSIIQNTWQHCNKFNSPMKSKLQVCLTFDAFTRKLCYGYKLIQKI